MQRRQFAPAAGGASAHSMLCFRPSTGLQPTCCSGRGAGPAAASSRASTRVRRATESIGHSRLHASLATRSCAHRIKTYLFQGGYRCNQSASRKRRVRSRMVT